MAATEAAQCVETAFLRRGSHTVEELTQRAVRYVEREIWEWSATQTTANVYLYNFLFGSDTFLTWQSSFFRDPKLGSDIVAHIGDLFLLGGLKEVVFQFNRDMTAGRRDTFIGLTRSSEDVGEVIRINADHAVFQEAPPSDQRRLFFSAVLHESVHAFFERFATISYTGHHHGFQLVAAAIERRASLLYGLDFDLFRQKAFIDESRSMNQISLTNDQMRYCFGKQFLPGRSFNVLLNDGPPIRGLVPDDRYPPNPSDGLPRYSLWSKGTGRDFSFVEYEQ